MNFLGSKEKVDGKDERTGTAGVGCVMNLTEHQVAELLKIFRNRAQKWMRKAMVADNNKDIVQFTAFASTYDWAALEVRVIAGIPEPARETETVTRERALADAALHAEDARP
jgi:hypothetical protein